MRVIKQHLVLISVTIYIANEPNLHEIAGEPRISTNSERLIEIGPEQSSEKHKCEEKFLCRGTSQTA